MTEEALSQQGFFSVSEVILHLDNWSCQLTHSLCFRFYWCSQRIYLLPLGSNQLLIILYYCCLFICYSCKVFSHLVTNFLGDPCGLLWSHHSGECTLSPLYLKGTREFPAGHYPACFALWESISWAPVLLLFTRNHLPFLFQAQQRLQ